MNNLKIAERLIKRAEDLMNVATKGRQLSDDAVRAFINYMYGSIDDLLDVNPFIIDTLREAIRANPDNFNEFMKE